MRRKGVVLAVFVLGAALLAVGIAVATPGSGITSGPVLFANGVIDDDFSMQTRLKIHEATIVANLKDPSNVFLQEINWGASGGHTGWHSHPGPVLVFVVSGGTFPTGDPDAGATFAIYDTECEKRSYNAGEVAVDPGRGHVHIGRAAPNVKLYAVYFDVPADAPSPPFRIDVSPAPATCF